MRREKKWVADKVKEHIEQTTGKIWTGNQKSWRRQFVNIFSIVLRQTVKDKLQ